MLKPLRGLSACSPRAGVVDLFASAAPGGIWHRTFDGAWTDWTEVGGEELSNPVAVSPAPGRTELYALGADMQLHVRRDGGSASAGWEALGAIVPPAASVRLDQLTVLRRGTGPPEILFIVRDTSPGGRRDLCIRTLDGPTEVLFTGGTFDRFAAALSDSGDLHVFARSLLFTPPPIFSLLRRTRTGAPGRRRSGSPGRRASRSRRRASP